MKNYNITTVKTEISYILDTFESKYFELASRKPKLYKPVSKAALYNYAISLLNNEFRMVDKEDREEILKQYK